MAGKVADRAGAAAALAELFFEVRRSDSVQEILYALNDGVRVLGAIRTDFEDEVERNKKRVRSRTYVEWLHRVMKIEDEVTQVRDIAQSIHQSNKRKRFWFVSARTADFREDMKRIHEKVINLYQEIKEIRDKLLVDCAPACVVKREGPDINKYDCQFDCQLRIYRSNAKLFTEIVDELKMNPAPNHPRAAYHKDEGYVNAKIVEPPKYITPNGEFKRNIKDWQKGKFLGRGCFGAVYEVLNGDGSFFALKEVSLLDQGPWGMQCISQLEQEISLLSQFEHENIVQYIGREKDDSKLYIFLELATKGSLLNLYQTWNLGDSQVSVYTRQILNGLKYLHGQNVVHRDIKCANILVDASGSVKLADFGLAKVAKLNDLKSSKGTPLWMAPEVVNQTKRGYGLAADIWSLGCTVLEMLTGKFPYSSLEEAAALFKIGGGKRPDIPPSLSKDARDFICKCLEANPDDRPTAAELLEHPFVKLSSSDSVDFDST